MYNWFTGDATQFTFKECTIGGDDCVLITPTNSVMPIWNNDNSIYRSSIWRVSDGKLISAGYRKFVNFGEQPKFEPVDVFNTELIAVEKIDGSCLICSKHNDEYIFRTRGTVDAHFLCTGNELDGLIEKYNVKHVIDELTDEYGEVTLLFEWVTPNNVICIHYDEPDFYLTGIVLHKDYSYFLQNDLDRIADKYGFIRPKRYNFSNFENLNDLAQDIRDTFVSKEGIVCYFENGQVLKKMKSDWYLFLHRAKSTLNSEKHIAEWMIDNNLLSMDDSFNCINTIDSIENTFANIYDWEIVNYIRTYIHNIFDRFTVFANNCHYAYEIIKDFNDPYQVVNALKNDSKLNASIAWPIFRHAPFNKNYFMKCILETETELN